MRMVSDSRPWVNSAGINEVVLGPLVGRDSLEIPEWDGRFADVMAAAVSGDEPNADGLTVDVDLCALISDAEIR